MMTTKYHVMIVLPSLKGYTLTTCEIDEVLAGNVKAGKYS